MKIWAGLLAVSVLSVLVFCAIILGMFVMGIGPLAKATVALPDVSAGNFESWVALGAQQRGVEELVIGPVIVGLSALVLFMLRIRAGWGRSLVAVAPVAALVDFGSWRLPLLLALYLVLHFALHWTLVRVGEKQATRVWI